MPPGVGPEPRHTPPPPPGSGLVPNSVQPLPRARPSAHPPPRANATARIALIGATAGAIVVIAVLTYVAYPKAAPPTATSSGPVAAQPSSAPPQQGPVEPIDFLGRAKTRAVAWNSDAQLVAISVGPVVAGKVPRGANEIRFTFASPGSKLGPGARVGNERFVVRMTGPDRLQGEKANAADGATRSVADPGCTVEQAWRAAVASGVPSSAEATMTYEHNDKYDRAVWRTEAADDPKHNRTLDGRRCTILTR